MTYSFEKSKVRIVRQINNKVVGFVTTRKLGMVNEIYGIEKDKKKVPFIMTWLLKSQKNI